jgi:hypothetical protein
MPYAKGAGYDPKKGCLQGTREKVIDEICQWVNRDGDDVPRMFLLIGVAGTGKSAIAHTVAQRFDAVGRLGSSFCFDKSHQEERRPDNLFSTIARDLADLDPQRRQCLWEVIQGKRALRTTSAPGEQFEQFILKPAAGVSSVGPTVIVIDALDESADPMSRRVLLSTLVDKIGGLPSNFRVLVTARAEDDIRRAIRGNQDIICKYMDTIDPESSDDISYFIRYQLADIPSLEHTWPDGAWCQLLTKKSEGLFQWAFTACHFVRGNGKGGLDPAEQLEILVSPSPHTNQTNHLDQLYLTVLTQIFDANNVTAMERFRLVLGRILAAKQPLSVSALRELGHQRNYVDVVGLILWPLGSLLSGVAQESVPVRLLHTSFRDFLTSPDRSGSFFVDTSLHQGSLAFACLRVMRTGLQFNICKLETSHVRNRDIPGLATRVKDTISTSLSYASRFWASHLRAAPFDMTMLKEVKDFIDNHFLYWLEVLSLTGEVNVARTVLSSVIAWSRVSVWVTELSWQKCSYVWA